MQKQILCRMELFWRDPYNPLQKHLEQIFIVYFDLAQSDLKNVLFFNPQAITVLQNGISPFGLLFF